MSEHKVISVPFSRKSRRKHPVEPGSFHNRVNFWGLFVRHNLLRRAGGEEKCTGRPLRVHEERKARESSRNVNAVSCCVIAPCSVGFNKASAAVRLPL